MSALLAAPPATAAQPVDAAPVGNPPGSSRLYTPPLEEERNAQISFEPIAPKLQLTAPARALLRLSYGESDVDLAKAERAKLQSFAEKLRGNGVRVELRSYAGPKGGTSSPSRRLALKRVLAVRQFLLSQGIEADRLIVRALGGVRDTGPDDRIDIIKSES